jgi:branched-chain amino acid transport system substrate-binding protein
VKSTGTTGKEEMKDKIEILLAVMLMTAVLIAPQARGAEPDSIKIAALYNLTGGMSSIDLPASNGARLAAKLVNKQGGVLGGRLLEIVPFDTKTDERSTIEEARKAVNAGIVAAIGYGDSTYVLLAAPLFQSRGIPFVTSGATLPDLPKRIGDCLFMVAFGDDAQARAIAEFAYKNLKARNAVVWTDSTMDFTRALAGYFRDHFGRLGGRVLDEASFAAGEKDFSRLIASLKATNPQPDAVFISATPDEAGLTVKQIREAGITTPILSGDGFDTDLVVSGPGKALAFNVYFATHIFRGEKGEEARDFVRVYTEEYGHAPESAFAALGFDAVRLIAESVTRAGTTEPKSLIETIGATRGFKGVTGEISFRDPRRPPDKPVSIIGVKNGEYEALGVWRPCPR